MAKAPRKTSGKPSSASVKPATLRGGRQAMAQAMAAAAGGSTGSTPRIYRSEEVVPRSILPSGHETIDWGFGNGGLPAGRVLTYTGPPACGKTTFAIENIIEVQKRGGIGYYFDFENKFDMDYAVKLGVDPNYFILDAPLHIQDAMAKFEKSIKVLRESAPDMPAIYVWDSVSSAKAKDTEESDWEDYNWAREARVYADKLPKFCRMVADTNAIVIGIAQKRTGMAGRIAINKVGPGHAWEHHTLCVLDWSSRKRSIGKIGAPDGEEVEIEFIKNQVGVPFKKVKLYMVYGEGYDQYWSLLHHATMRGVVDLNGSYYSFAGKTFGQGKEKAIEAMQNDEKLTAAIRAPLRADYSAIEVSYEEPESEPEPEKE